jgi:caffeoyl-CoA O-methyltransferase
LKDERSAIKLCRSRILLITPAREPLMSPRSIGLSQQLYDWLIANTLRETEPLRRLREETATLARAGMQISPEQGQFMAVLVRLIGARRVLEIGTFTGYSAMVVAQALPDGGRIVACDVSAEYTTVAQRHWAAAGLAHKIDLRLAPALDTLTDLLKQGAAGTFDMAFIDADKENYAAYYEQCLKLVRPGGLLLLDNMLWHGSVADPADQTESTKAIRALAKLVRDDARVDQSLVPIGDGLLLARIAG